MRANWDCAACAVCREFQAGNNNLQELFDLNNAVYLEMGGAHKFMFPDGSILIIDDEGEASFVNIQVEKHNVPPTPPKVEKKESWFGKLCKNKLGIGIAVGSVVVSGAAVVGAMYYSKH